MALVIALAVLYAKGGGVAGALHLVGDILRQMASTLLILGAVVMVGAAWTWRRSSRVKAWPTTSGVITESRVESRIRQVGNSTYRGSAKLRFYRPVVSYTYDVDGTRHQGHRVRLADRGWERTAGHSEGAIARYAVGQSVTVRYNPSRPADAVLEIGMGPLWPQAVVFSTLCLVLGAYGWLTA